MYIVCLYKLRMCKVGLLRWIRSRLSTIQTVTIQFQTIQVILLFLFTPSSTNKLYFVSNPPFKIKYIVDDFWRPSHNNILHEIWTRSLIATRRLHEIWTRPLITTYKFKLRFQIWDHSYASPWLCEIILKSHRNVLEE